MGNSYTAHRAVRRNDNLGSFVKSKISEFISYVKVFDSLKSKLPKDVADSYDTYSGVLTVYLTFETRNDIGNLTFIEINEKILHAITLWKLAIRLINEGKPVPMIAIND
jgi:hypothetical protein